MLNQTGELVITEPLPSMPMFLWNDQDGSRYRASYFDMYPGVWRHGDWIKITDHGSAVIQGRSDSTLNRLGLRIGSSEIYTAVESLAEVRDSTAVHNRVAIECHRFEFSGLPSHSAALGVRLSGATPPRLQPVTIGS